MKHTVSKLLLLIFALAVMPLQAQYDFDDAEEIGEDDAGGETEGSKKRYRKEKEMSVTGDRTLGTVTLRLNYGVYNFDTTILNRTTGDERVYSLDGPGWFMAGGEIAVRLGKDSDKFHHQGNNPGFMYYRSNRGIFTDMEFGFKTFVEDKPTKYNYTSSNNGGNSNLVDLGGTVDVGGVKVLTYDPAANNNAGTNDGISEDNRVRYGGAAALATMLYFNNYYHFSPLNYIMNFGSGFRWFDSSLGVSLRLFRYSDYSDPERLLENADDNTNTTFALVYRQYIQFHPRVRLRTHYYYPFVDQVARWARSTKMNEEEHVLDTGIDIYLINYLYISVGYEYHFWKHNPNARSRFVRYSAALPERQGYENISRASYELYGAVAIDVPFL